MADRLLLDTNAASAGIRLVPSAVAVIIAAEAVFLPSVALGELYYGAFHAALASAQLERVRELEADSEVLNTDSATAQIYGRVKADLRSKDRMIPDNDLWIASITLQYNLAVMTQDAHFAEVGELLTMTW